MCCNDVFFVPTLQLELSSREQVILEADAVLAEANRRVAALAATVSQPHTSLDLQATRSQLQAAHPGSIPSTHGAGAASSASRRLTSSSSNRGSRTHTASSSSRAVTAAAEAARLGAGPSPGGSVHQVFELVLDHCRSLLAWCQEADARITRQVSRMVQVMTCSLPIGNGWHTHRSCCSSQCLQYCCAASALCSAQGQPDFVLLLLALPPGPKQLLQHSAEVHMCKAHKERLQPAEANKAAAVAVLVVEAASRSGRMQQGKAHQQRLKMLRREYSCHTCLQVGFCEDWSSASKGPKWSPLRGNPSASSYCMYGCSTLTPGRLMAYVRTA